MPSSQGSQLGAPNRSFFRRTQGPGLVFFGVVWTGTLLALGASLTALPLALGILAGIGTWHYFAGSEASLKRQSRRLERSVVSLERHSGARSVSVGPSGAPGRMGNLRHVLLDRPSKTGITSTLRRASVKFRYSQLSVNSGREIRAYARAGTSHVEFGPAFS